MLMICRPSGRFTPFSQTIFVRYALPFFIIRVLLLLLLLIATLFIHKFLASGMPGMSTLHTEMVEKQLRKLHRRRRTITFTTFNQCAIQSALLIYVFFVYVFTIKFLFLFLFCFCSYRHLFIGINFTDSSLFSALSLIAFARCHPSH